MSKEETRLVEGEDFYREGAMIVFTASHHLRRGYCCGSNCRHCPYSDRAVAAGGSETATAARDRRGERCP
ncbi:MAG: DUF5522 domain-containing protein, partial [Pyrinomonadaceae bacterium]